MSVTQGSNEGSLLIPFNVSPNLQLVSAFHALLTSVAPQHTGNLNPDALKKLSEKLGDLVGEDAVKGFNQARNERGEVCLCYTSTLGLLNRSYSACE
jgi:hypothetical protein